MLQANKPRVSKERWFEVLEGWHFELFQFKQEMRSGLEHLIEPRIPRVRAVLADLRLFGCMGYLSLQKTEKFSAADLFKAAEFLRRRIQDEWLWGRNWEMVMKTVRKGPKPKPPKKRGGKRRGRIARPKAVEGLDKMLSRITLLLSYGDDPHNPFPASLQVLCAEVEAILKHRMFRNCFWSQQMSKVLLYDELFLRSCQAKETIEAFLEEIPAPKKKLKKPTKATKKPQAAVKTDASAKWPFPR